MYVDFVFVAGGKDHSKTELLSLSTWSWEKRKSCPLSKLARTPTIYTNGQFYVFGQKAIENELTSVVAAFDPINNKWLEIGSFGNVRVGHQVIQSKFGVVIVGGDFSDVKSWPRVCQISSDNVNCEDLVNVRVYLEEAFSPAHWHGNEVDVKLFTFNYKMCPEKIKGFMSLTF